MRSRWAGETDPIGFEVELDGFRDHPGLSATYTLRIADSPAGLYVLEEILERTEPEGDPEWVFQRRGLRPRAMGEFGEVDPYEPTLLHRVYHNHPSIDHYAPNVAFALQYFDLQLLGLRREALLNPNASYSGYHATHQSSPP